MFGSMPECGGSKDKLVHILHFTTYFLMNWQTDGKGFVESQKMVLGVLLFFNYYY